MWYSLQCRNISSNVDCQASLQAGIMWCASLCQRVSAMVGPDMRCHLAIVPGNSSWALSFANPSITPPVPELASSAVEHSLSGLTFKPNPAWTCTPALKSRVVNMHAALIECTGVDAHQYTQNVDQPKSSHAYAHTHYGNYTQHFN